MSKYQGVRINKSADGRQWVVEGQSGCQWHELLRYPIAKQAIAVTMAGKVAAESSMKSWVPVAVTMEGREIATYRNGALTR